MSEVLYSKKKDMLYSYDDTTGEKKVYGDEEVLTLLFNNINEKKQQKTCLPDDVQHSYGLNFSRILRRNDNYEMTYRTLTGLLRGLVGMNDIYDGVGPADDRERLAFQVENLWSDLMVHILKDPTPERTKAAFDAINEFSMFLLSAYGAYGTTEIFKKLRAKLVTNLSDDITKYFWAAVPDEFNYDIKKGGRWTNVCNMVAYLALECLKQDGSYQKAKDYIEEFETYSCAIHLVTAVYPETLSIDYIIDKGNRKYSAPTESDNIPLKEARYELKAMAKDETVNPLIRFYSYWQTAKISSATEALLISKKQQKLLKDITGSKITWFDPLYQKKGHSIWKGISICAITGSALWIVYTAFTAWWDSAASIGFKNFWIGIPGLVVFLVANAIFYLWCAQSSGFTPSETTTIIYIPSHPYYTMGYHYKGTDFYY